MKSYLKYFKTELLVGLQYKEAAIAGLFTQFFWGVLYAFLYKSFYSHTNIKSINYTELMCYVWLTQTFFSMVVISIKDHNIISMIKDGSVVYELCRPYNLYFWWYMRLLSKRYAAVTLRSLPILIFAIILPKPYGLASPISMGAFIMFIITLLLGSFIVVGISMLIQCISFFTIEDRGVAGIFCTIGDLLSGFQLPIPLLPVFLITFTKYLPFRFIGDLSFRIYSGNISLSSSYNLVLWQIFWIFMLILIGNLILKIALRRMVIQGG